MITVWPYCSTGSHYTEQVLLSLCPLPVEVVYSSPVVLHCDQQRELRLKQWNLPVTDTKWADWCVELLVVRSWFGGEPLPPLKHHSCSNSFLRCVRAHLSQHISPESLPTDSSAELSSRGRPQQTQGRGRLSTQQLHSSERSITAMLVCCRDDDIHPYPHGHCVGSH